MSRKEFYEALNDAAKQYSNANNAIFADASLTPQQQQDKSEEIQTKMLKGMLTKLESGDDDDKTKAAEWKDTVENATGFTDLDAILDDITAYVRGRRQSIPGGRRSIRRSAYSRRSYTRRSGVKVRGSRVHARMIPDVGAPGKWRAEHMGAPGIGPLKKGDLSSVGYSVTAKTSTRRKAVDRAVKKYGKTGTIRKLNAVAVYTRRTSPTKSKVFKADMKYVQKNK